MNKRLTVEIVGVLIVVAVAGLFRLYGIQEYPAGLFPDEAANGEDALLVLDGDYRAFYPRGNGREGLYYYLEALAIKVAGVGVWQLHSVSAIIGILTVFAMYFATKPFFGRLSGLFAAFFMATSYWQVTLSRTGFRAILIPLFLAAFTAFVGYTIQSVKQNKKQASYIYAALAGAAFMGGFYTYIAYRVMIGVVIGIFVFMLLAAIHPKIGFPHIRRYGKQMLVAIIAGLIVFAPLGWYFIQQPEAFVGRAGQVSVFNKELQQEYGGGTLVGTIAYSTQETLLSFFAGEGDLNWRHNVAGYPLLNPLVGILFLLGLAWAINGLVMVIRKIVEGEEMHMGMMYPYVLLLLSGMLVPVITTAEGIPHGLRSLGLAVPIFMLAGTAGAVVYRWVNARVRGMHLRAVIIGCALGAIVLSGLYDGLLYFVVAQNDAEAAYDYRADLTDVSQYILDYVNQHPDAARPYLVLDPFSLQTPHFLTHQISNGAIYPSPHDYLEHPDEGDHLYRSLDPASSHMTPIKEGEIIIFTQSTISDADRYAEMHSATIDLVESRRNRFNEEIMRIYKGVGVVPTVQGVESSLDA